MGAIESLDQISNTYTGGEAAFEIIHQYCDARIGAGAGAACVIGQLTSLWTFNSTPTGQGVAPGGTARVPTRATTGALGQANATGGRQKWLMGAFVRANLISSVVFYDRLADISGLNATTTTAQTITGLAVDRYSGTESVGNRIMLEIYTIIGTTATTITVEYTNQAGTTGKVSKAVAFGGTGRREATRMISVPLADGDTGVREVTNVDILATTGTAGDFGVTIVRPLATAMIAVASTGVIIDLLTGVPGQQEILEDACLCAFIDAGAVTSPSYYADFSFMEA